MPIYEYQCTQCGTRFEARQSIGEDGSGLSCPDCNAGNPKRLLSSFFSSGSGSTEPSGSSCSTCGSGVCGPVS